MWVELTIRTFNVLQAVADDDVALSHLLHGATRVHLLDCANPSVLHHVGLRCEGLCHTSKPLLRDTRRSDSVFSHGGLGRTALLGSEVLLHLLAAHDLVQDQKLRRGTRRHLHFFNQLLLRKVLQLILGLDDVHHWTALYRERPDNPAPRACCSGLYD